MARPRPPASRRRRPSRRVVRFGRQRLSLLGLALLVVGLGVMASGPYADYVVAQERVSALEDRQAELDESVSALEVEADRLQDPAALEEQARSQLGLVRPGEIPYIVVNPPTEAPPAPVNANPELDEDVEEGASVVDRVRAWVQSLTS
ncbi:hypothetical protein BH23ACT9_BH23ACT9_12970 [soil metagenome]